MPAAQDPASAPAPLCRILPLFGKQKSNPINLFTADGAHWVPLKDKREKGRARVKDITLQPVVALIGFAQPVAQFYVTFEGDPAAPRLVTAAGCTLVPPLRAQVLNDFELSIAPLHAWPPASWLPPNCDVRGLACFWVVRASVGAQVTFRGALRLTPDGAPLATFCGSKSNAAPAAQQPPAVEGATAEHKRAQVEAALAAARKATVVAHSPPLELPVPFTDVPLTGHKRLRDSLPLASSVLFVEEGSQHAPSCAPFSPVAQELQFLLRTVHEMALVSAPLPGLDDACSWQGIFAPPV